MESAKIPHHHNHHHHHHHQNQQQLPLQDHQLVVSSTTLEYAPGYAAPTAHAWTSNSTALNINGSFDSSANAPIIHSRNPRFQHDILVSSLNGSLTHQDLSFNWDNSVGNNYTNIQSSHESQLSRFKRELSNSCPNLSEMISSPSSSIEDVQLDPPSYGKTDPNVKLLISTVSPGGQSNSFPSCPEEFYCATSSSLSLAATPKRRTSSQIYPTINVSNISQTSLENSSSFDMNLQALDLLHSARFTGDFRQSLQDQLVISRNALSNYGFDYVRQSIPMPSESSNTTPFSNGEKSCNTKFEAKVPQAAAQKRSRVDPRPSCQPLKVRKEKLGDRIAALQQLVAPFGKTDTATVLMEAIGYIKFLQNQVETLSVPYLKSSRNNNSRAMHHGGPAENGSDQERKRDLKSRGLCLVPTSCLSYMTDTGGTVWPPPPTYGGATS